MHAVPALFPGSTATIIATGPSLTPADVAATRRSNGPVIVVNDAHRLAPWADILYAADEYWWERHVGVPSFRGLKYSIEPTRAQWRGLHVLRNTGVFGLELDPAGLRTGFNSGYQAINLAVHLGARRMILLGFDMGPAPDGRTHWFGDHPDAAQRPPSPYREMIAAFDTMVEPLAQIGAVVVNCSRVTRLTTFPTVPLEDAFDVFAAGEGLL